MKREDTRDFIKDVMKIYPNWKVTDMEELSAIIDIWHRYLEKEEKDHIEKALDEYVTVERNKFAPSVSDIINLAKKFKPDPRFEGVDYWEMRTKGIYPYTWDSKAYREWYTTDNEASRFFKYLTQGIEKAEKREIKEDELENLKSVLKVYERKKCLMMKKD